MASPSSAPRRSRQSTDAMADYRIEEKAGKGSFATVYKGRHRVSLLFLHSRFFPAKLPMRSISRDPAKSIDMDIKATVFGERDKLT